MYGSNAFGRRPDRLGEIVTIPELETELLYRITSNERKRLRWYKQQDEVKFVKEIWKLWTKYSEVENG